MDVQFLSVVGLPVLMAVGGIAAWRMSKKENSTFVEKPVWRDNSLDDWRKERDAEVEQERILRSSTEGTLHEGGAAEEKSETQRHQRIGG
ncbi:MAG: hypothetical protein ABI305_14270 [Tepidiformaceae bacterium]